jgi:hypothetical protein
MGSEDDISRAFIGTENSKGFVLKDIQIPYGSHRIRRVLSEVSAQRRQTSVIVLIKFHWRHLQFL